MAVLAFVTGRAGYHLFRLRAGLKARWRSVPDGPALFVYGHSQAALEGAKVTPWPVFVADRLGLPLVNRAVGGDVARDTERRAKVRRGRPGPRDLVLVHTGGNDVLRYGHDPQLGETYRATLARIVDQLERSGATLRVLAEFPLQDWTRMPRGYTHGSDEATAAVNAAGMSFPGAIDLRRGWDPATMLQDDRLHSNELGVATLTGTILEGLQPAQDESYS